MNVTPGCATVLVNERDSWLISVKMEKFMIPQDTKKKKKKNDHEKSYSLCSNSQRLKQQYTSYNTQSKPLSYIQKLRWDTGINLQLDILVSLDSDCCFRRKF